MGSEKEKVNGTPLHALKINDHISSGEHCHHFEFGASSERTPGVKSASARVE